MLDWFMAVLILFGFICEADVLLVTFMREAFMLMFRIATLASASFLF